jgi:hypothetical protein
MLVCGIVKIFTVPNRLKSGLQIWSVLSRNLGVFFEQKVRFRISTHSLTVHHCCIYFTTLSSGMLLWSMPSRTSYPGPHQEFIFSSLRNKWTWSLMRCCDAWTLCGCGLNWDGDWDGDWDELVTGKWTGLVGTELGCRLDWVGDSDWWDWLRPKCPATSLGYVLVCEACVSARGQAVCRIPATDTRSRHYSLCRIYDFFLCSSYAPVW